MGWLFGKHNNTIRLNSSGTRACAGNINAVIATHTGNVRLNNEDTALICYPDSASSLLKKGLLFLVADGMGGHNSGEIASALAADSFKEAYFQHKGDALTALKFAVKKANKVVYEASQSNTAYNGMGTTLTAIAAIDNSLFLAHVGDSRAYLFTKNAFKRLSKDQTLVQQLVDAGTITLEAAAAHPQKNILLNALGAKANVEASVMQLDECLTDDNLLLLCSDGLYDMVSEPEINSIIQRTNNMDEIVQHLINLARNNGGYDNITILLAAKKSAFQMQSFKITEDVDISLMNENVQP